MHLIYNIILTDKVYKRYYPMDNFSIDAVYAYGLRLMLIERMRKFEVENGKTSYHKIYDNILENNGDI